jgi:hypothetical protein
MDSSTFTAQFLGQSDSCELLSCRTVIAADDFQYSVWVWFRPKSSEKVLAGPTSNSFLDLDVNIG